MPQLRLTRRNAGTFGSFILALVALTLCCCPLTAQDNASGTTTVREAVGFAVSPQLRELAKLPREPRYRLHEAPPIGPIPKRDFGVSVDPVEQGAPPPAANYSIGQNLLGVGNSFPGFSDTFPDPYANLAVGNTQIVQWANASFAVFNKFNGAILAGPIAGNLLFSALGGACAANNDGGLIVQWDNAAHQWLLAQNVLVGPPYYACVAVSTSADALGTYYLYAFPLGNGFPDYQEWGRWNNNWAQTMNNFGPGGSGFVGAEVCVYNRTAILNGQSGPPAIQVCHQYSINDDSLLPADIDSSNSPPAAENQFFIGSVDAVDNSHLSLYSVNINWLHPSLAMFTGPQLIAVPTYTGSCNGLFGVIDCVPQKGVSDKLESLGDRLMYRFAYDNDPVGGVQHWYVNHDVEASGGQIGVRWYEFQAPQISIPPGGLTLFQSGTYSPDSNYRWMGSIAADSNKDILAGYSVSSSSVYPSISIAGRLKTDPPGMLESEVPVVVGTGSQTDTNDRWGDYSAMRLDPDGCTFWYTTEYYMLTASFDWSTQIASARFATCQNPAYDGYLEICKQTDPDYPVPGPFTFTVTAPFFSTGPIVVPVGACSPPTQVPSGVVTINEVPQVGVAVENVTAYSYDQYGNYVNELDSWTPPQPTATITVVPGGVSLETVATYTNYAAPPGTLKICKIAGAGVTIGTLFNFTTTDGTTRRMDQVEAGPAPGGYCVVDGPWPVNDPVTITEVNIPPGVSVSSITDSQGQGQLSPCQPPESYCTVATIISGINEVTFTDVLSVTPGSCQPSESLSLLVVPTGNGCNLAGGCVVAWVPKASWDRGVPGVAVANVEGSYITGAPLLVATAYQGVSDYINSCASNPLLKDSSGHPAPQTVCSASNRQQQSPNVYVITGNNPPTVANVLQTSGSGMIQFSGGDCTNCGVAMDALHSKAVIGLSLPPVTGGLGAPGYQFVSLNGNPALDAVEMPAIPSQAGQISEDILIDPVSNRLLSPGEGEFLCFGSQCMPNYEIGTITYNPINGNAELQFYENNLKTNYNTNTYPLKFPGGEPDSAAEDCNAQIGLSSIEGNPSGNPTKGGTSTPFVADLAAWVPVVGNPGTWTDPLSGFFPLLNSVLNQSDGTESGPIAVAQGTSHEGVLAQETFSGSANTITAFQLNFPYNSTTPFSNWVTCNIGTDLSTGVEFDQGIDPHTVSAYQSPNKNGDGTYHSYAVIANQMPNPDHFFASTANTIAVVDLDMMLLLSQSNGVCTTPGGTLPSSVVTFLPLCSPSPSCQQ